MNKARWEAAAAVSKAAIHTLFSHPLETARCQRLMVPSAVQIQEELFCSLLSVASSSGMWGEPAVSGSQL